MPGVMAIYKLIGNAHKKAININNFLDIIDEMIAKQAGRNNMMNVFTMGSISSTFE